MSTFRQIQGEISAMLDVPDAELTPEQKAEMDAYLAELGQQEADKVDAFAQFLRLETARMEALKEEARRLSGRARTIESRLSWLKAEYLGIMQYHGLQKVQGNAYTLSTRKSSVVVVPADISGLPEIFLRRKETVEADKAVIKDALKAGQDVPGCELRDSYSLQVK